MVKSKKINLKLKYKNIYINNFKSVTLVLNQIKCTFTCFILFNSKFQLYEVRFYVFFDILILRVENSNPSLYTKKSEVKLLEQALISFFNIVVSLFLAAIFDNNKIKILIILIIVEFCRLILTSYGGEAFTYTCILFISCTYNLWGKV